MSTPSLRINRVLIYIFLVIGASATFISLFDIPYANPSLLALTGLTLIFWGVLFLYLTPHRYVNARVVDSSVMPLYRVINPLLAQLDYRGKPVYVKTDDAGDVKIRIPKRDRPPVEGHVESIGDDALLLTPPGIDLAELYERDGGLLDANLDHIQARLSTTLHKMNLARRVEIQSDGAILDVELIEPLLTTFCNDLAEHSPVVTIGCPLCSSVAVILTRVTGMSLTLERCQLSRNEKACNIHFHTVEAASKE